MPVWTKPPPLGTRLDLSHPLLRDFRYAFRPDGAGAMAEFGKRFSSTREQAVDPQRVNTLFGPARKYDGSLDTQYERFSIPSGEAFTNATPGVSILTLFTISEVNGVGGNTGIVWIGNSGSDSSWFSFETDSAENIEVRARDGGNQRNTAWNTPNTDEPLMHVAVVNGGTDIWSYTFNHAGALLDSRTTNGADAAQPGGWDRISFGRLDDNTPQSPFHDGWTALSIIVARQFTQEEAQQWAANPWQIFKPRRFPAYRSVNRTTLTIKRPWYVQPPGAVPLDGNHPLVRGVNEIPKEGMLWCWQDGGNYGRDYSRNRFVATEIGTGGLPEATSATNKGLAYQNDGSLAMLDIDVDGDTGTHLTFDIDNRWAAWAYFNLSDTDHDDTGLLSRWNFSAETRYLLRVDQGAGAQEVEVFISSTGAAELISTAVINENAWYLVVSESVGDGTTHTLRIFDEFGQRLYSGSDTISTQSSGMDSTIQIGGNKTGTATINDELDGSILQVGVARGNYSDSVWSSLAVNPWQIFKPRLWPAYMTIEEIRELQVLWIKKYWTRKPPPWTKADL